MGLNVYQLSSTDIHGSQRMNPSDFGRWLFPEFHVFHTSLCDKSQQLLNELFMFIISILATATTTITTAFCLRGKIELLFKQWTAFFHLLWWWHNISAHCDVRCNQSPQRVAQIDFSQTGPAARLRAMLRGRMSGKKCGATVVCSIMTAEWMKMSRDAALRTWETYMR